MKSNPPTNAVASVRASNALPPPPPAALCAALKINTITIDWLAGDGSDRCYYRLTSPDLPINSDSNALPSLVLMQLSGSDAAALKSGGYEWIKIAEILGAKGIKVPRVIATVPDHAALIIEDYGDVMLESVIIEKVEQNDFATITNLYRSCFENLATFLAITPAAGEVWTKRSFDEERFIWELNFFVAKFLEPVTKIVLNSAERQQFSREISSLAKFLAARSKFFVHRDFHSRNVMVCNGKLAILDFQDARLGPPSYDLVSLCFDSYVPFNRDLRHDLLSQAIAIFEKSSGKQVAESVREEWKPMLLQRQLKAIGSFGFLTIDKNRGNYLKYVQPALRTIIEQNLQDDRWPFVSGTLIERIATSFERAPHIV